MRIENSIPLLAAHCSLIATSICHAQQPHDVDYRDTEYRDTEYPNADYANTDYANADDGRRSPLSLSTLHAGQSSIGIHVFSAKTITGNRAVGGQLIIQIPFERLLTPRRHAMSPPSFSEPPPKPQTPPATQQAPKPRVSVKPALARAAVRAAWRANGISDVEVIDSMKSRARTSAILPETRFRVSRDWDQSYRLSPTNDDPYRLHETTGGGMKIEGTVTWKLNRLLFVNEELSMERLRIQQSQARSKLAGEVLKALFEWQRAQILLQDPDIDDAERIEAAIKEAESIVLLDVLTGGWFSSWLATGK